MKKMGAAGAVLALALAGCAAAPQDEGDAAGAPAVANNTAGQDGHQMTGSRLKRDSTDRMLKAVGAQGARDEIDKAPRPLQTQ
ncbi:hypothetical protein [Massilia sp. X63]|jgi:hypothetical protein|uniref:hypothetical protein n=1 Tax=Massilia sp. X63 TaxID=3237285 RepID=UPI0034DCDBC0